MERQEPYIRVGANGEAEIVDRQPESEQRELTTYEKLAQLSPEELEQLKADALEQYSELELLVHSINRFQDAQQGETLF